MVETVGYKKDPTFEYLSIHQNLILKSQIFIFYKLNSPYKKVKSFAEKKTYC
jgi:hypothetical protein